VKGWYAVIPALLLLLSRGATAANNPNEGARELARKIGAFASARDTVALTLRPMGQASATAAASIRKLLDSALRETGVRLDSSGAVEVRVTLSETPGHRLLVTEARRGDDRQTWIVSWPSDRVDAAVEPTAARLETRLLWEQAEPILDAALTGDVLVVLSVSRIVVAERTAAGWETKQTAPFAPPRPWPRDPRARLALSGTSLRVYVPGGVCNGSWQPSLSVECRAMDEPWLVDSAGRHMLLAWFAAGRNYFDGRIATQAGVRKAVQPFYSAAAVEEAGEALWVFAGMDGRAVLTDRSFALVATLGNWGSDVAGAGVRCNGSAPLLASRAGDEGEAVQAFAVVNRQAEPLAPPIAMAGPVTALWPAPGGALAVVRDGSTERYAAYLVTITCAQ
jgi:hypothetical protein